MEKKLGAKKELPKTTLPSHAVMPFRDRFARKAYPVSLKRWSAHRLNRRRLLRSPTLAALEPNQTLFSPHVSAATAEPRGPRRRAAGCPRQVTFESVYRDLREIVAVSIAKTVCSASAVFQDWSERSPVVARFTQYVHTLNYPAFEITHANHIRSFMTLASMSTLPLPMREQIPVRFAFSPIHRKIPLTDSRMVLTSNK